MRCHCRGIALLVLVVLLKGFDGQLNVFLSGGGQLVQTSVRSVQDAVAVAHTTHTDGAMVVVKERHDGGVIGTGGAVDIATQSTMVPSCKQRKGTAAQGTPRTLVVGHPGRGSEIGHLILVDQGEGKMAAQNRMRGLPFNPPSVLRCVGQYN